MNALPILAALSVTSFVWAFLWVLAIAAICWLLDYLVKAIAPPEPFFKFLRILIVAFGVFFLINVILSLMGNPIVRLHGL